MLGVQLVRLSLEEESPRTELYNVVAPIQVSLFKLHLNEIKNSVAESHNPHLECSVFTCGQQLVYLDSTGREHFHYARKICWAAVRAQGMRGSMGEKKDPRGDTSSAYLLTG